jgi:hypothetical protein
VPKGGLEPPHPCEYMDLNHARLPIPPLRHGVIRSGQTEPEHANRELLVLQTGRRLSIPEPPGGPNARLLSNKSVYCLKEPPFLK